MNNKLNTVLAKINFLPKKDQLWIFQRLSERQKKILRWWNKPDAFAQPSLPDYCQELAKKNPLYIAIILEQSSCRWEQPFIKLYQLEETINEMKEKNLSVIKLGLKKKIHNDWQQRYLGGRS